MPYNPSSDFVGLWRAISGGVEKAEMPGLDFVVAALDRAGILNVVTSTTAPTADQATTAWFQPANPSFGSEGTLFLWDATLTMYVPATPALFFDLAGPSGGGGGIPEAPTDGAQYGRQSSAWTHIVGGSGGSVVVQPSPPASPATGAQWWDGSVLRVWDGTAWKAIGPSSQEIVLSPTPPVSPFPGMMWWNATQLQIYDGVTWKLIGPPLGPTSLPLETSTMVFSITQATTLTVPTTSWGAIPYVDTPAIDAIPGSWDPVTHKYTPKKAGYYLFNVRGAPHTAGGIAVVKNDTGTPLASLASNIVVAMSSSADSTWQATSGVAQMNGTTDYVRAFALSQTSGTMDIIGAVSPAFSALRLP